MRFHLGVCLHQNGHHIENRTVVSKSKLATMIIRGNYFLVFILLDIFPQMIGVITMSHPLALMLHLLWMKLLRIRHLL